MDLEDLIKQQLKNLEYGKFKYVEDTGWLERASADDIEKHYKDYAKKAQSLINEIIDLKGKTSHHSSQDNFFETWFPELFYGAAWRVDGKYLFVGAVHHDKETPVALILGALTEDEIKELKADDEW
jgi:hypothetical protein